MMKRILCIILAVLLLTPAVFAAETMTLAVDQVTGEVGDTVTVKGTVTSAPSCASFRVILTYDKNCLKPLSGTRGNGASSGYGTVNTNATYNGQPAIVILAASASRALVGDAELFVLEFEIIGEPADSNYTPLTVAYQEFFNEDLKKVTPTVVSGKVTYPSLPVPDTGDTAPDGETNTPGGETNTPDGETNTPGGETNTPGGETNTPGGETNTPGGETNTPDKTPTGDWEVNPDTGDITHKDENGNENKYEGEFSQPLEPGTSADVTLKDEQGNEVGSIVVEKDEAGNVTVTEQDIPKQETPSTTPGSSNVTGDWIVAGDQFAHVDDDGSANLYEGEFKDEEPKNSGDQAEVILKDEDGKEVGSVVVEKEDDGSLSVVDQNLNKDKTPVWVWILIGGAVVLAAAAGVVGFLYFKKKKAAVTE